MNKILILYPHVFNVRSKFERKLNKILQNQDGGELVYLTDSRGFISDFCIKNKSFISSEIDEIHNNAITHAIVFDDGEEFIDEINWLHKNNIPLRWL